jgi:hypothetical protein
MSQSITIIRSPSGDPLDAETMATVRALIAERGARRLVYPLGVSVTAIDRAAAGGRVLRGTRVLIVAGLERMRATGELPPRGGQP